jgi:photosystem II stability/assembly factor-like uncharacterized protein
MATKKTTRKPAGRVPGRGPSRSRKRRPPPWYRRRATWTWIGLLAAIGALVAVLTLSGGDRTRSASSGEPFVGGDLHSLVVDPANPSRLFVGGHEGVAVSTNRGSSWTQVESLGGADAMGWAFDEGAILVGGHPGISRSTDGGRTFTQADQGLPSTDVHALGTGAGVVYGASPQVGVFVSTDGGSSWAVRTTGAGQSFMGSILVDRSNPDRVVAPDLQAGAVESQDGGRTWRALGGPQGARWVSWDPESPDRIVSSGVAGAALTEDGGDTWQQLIVPSATAIVELVPGRPGELYAAELAGGTARIWKSSDEGTTWTEL